MLTRLQHQHTRTLLDPHERQVYRLHMCGLCHALGDDYGLLSRLLTTHELILLNLLISAQQTETPRSETRRCPLNPLRHVQANQGQASHFAAAVSVELANASFRDDVEDAQGFDLMAHAASFMLHGPHRAALHSLRESGFDVTGLVSLNAQQATAERDGAGQPERPSARLAASLFAMTARLAGCPENVAPLTVIGEQFGAFIYLMDAYRDFAADMACGRFNPLARFAAPIPEGISLSVAGLRWLHSRFEEIERNIRCSFASLRLVRYDTLIQRLLCRPVADAIAELDRHTRPGALLRFRQWTLADVLRAAMFMVPPALASYALTTVSVGPPDLSTEEQPRRRRGSTWDCCDSCSYQRYDCGHVGGCGHLDCSGCHAPAGCDCTPGDQGSPCESCHIGDSCQGGDGCQVGDACQGGGDACQGADCGGVDCSS